MFAKGDISWSFQTKEKTVNKHSKNRFKGVDSVENKRQTSDTHVHVNLNDYVHSVKHATSENLKFLLRTLCHDFDIKVICVVSKFLKRIFSDQNMNKEL